MTQILNLFTLDNILQVGGVLLLVLFALTAIASMLAFVSKSPDSKLKLHYVEGILLLSIVAVFVVLILLSCAVILLNEFL